MSMRGPNLDLRVFDEKPKVRGDCEEGPRPCPWVCCRYHINSETESCALDVADDGPHTQEEVAKILGVSQERIAYIEKRAYERARRGGL